MIIERLLWKEKEMIVSVHVIILLQTSVVFHCFLYCVFQITHIDERVSEDDVKLWSEDKIIASVLPSGSWLF